MCIYFMYLPGICFVCKEKERLVIFKKQHSRFVAKVLGLPVPRICSNLLCDHRTGVAIYNWCSDGSGVVTAMSTGKWTVAIAIDQYT